jgi:hypothetical protein
MSWTGVQNLDGHKDPREYLDAFFESQQMLVLASTTLFRGRYAPRLLLAGRTSIFGITRPPICADEP